MGKYLFITSIISQLLNHLVDHYKVILDMNLNQESLWDILEIGDRSIQKLKRKVYMIVGLTKNGKSCLFNHLLGRPMIGKQDEQDCQRIIYVPKTTTEFKLADYAEMRSSFVSITLAPNIAALNAQYSLVDMLGFQENRNQKSIVCVSYFLKGCFQRAECVKFIVAISEQNLFTKSIKLFCDSFNQLVYMIAISRFEAKQKENFLDSISLVITSAKNKLEYNKKRLQTVIKQLGNSQLQTLKNREIIRQILQRVFGKDRMECFAQAIQHQSNQKCTILEKLNKKQWCDFKLEQVRSNKREAVINIRFKQEFSKLDTKFGARFKQTLKSKIQTLLNVNEVFKTYLEELRQNWDSHNLVNVYPIKVKQQIQKILQQKIYRQNAITERGINIPVNSSQNIFHIIKKSLQIYDQIAKLQLLSSPQVFVNTTFDRQMDTLNEIYSKIIDCLIPAFTSEKQLKDLVQIKFILSRSFEQFSKFNQLDPQMITTITRDMTDRAQLQSNKREHLQGFINKVDKNALNLMFKKMESILQYQSLLDDYRSIMQKDNLVDQLFMIKYMRLKLNAKNVRNEILSQEDKKWARLRNQAELVKTQLQLFNLYNSPNLLWTSDKSIEQQKGYKTKVVIFDFIKKNDSLTGSRMKMIQAHKQQKLVQSYNRIVRSINILMQLLDNITFKQYPQGYKYVLDLASYAKNPSFADRILAKEYAEQKNMNTKIGILDTHIGLCRKWGWLQQANKLLLSKREFYYHLQNDAKIKECNQELKKLGRQQMKWSQLDLTMQTLDGVFSEAEIKSLLPMLDSMVQQLSNKDK